MQLFTPVGVSKKQKVAVMTFFEKILGKNKKPVLKPRCPITKESIDPGFGYLLTTSEIISSKKYWDMVMTEPETMSYTVSHFKNQESGTYMRNLIFEKYSSIDKPWMISDSCVHLFEIDKSKARTDAKTWWETEGNFAPPQVGNALENLDPSSYQAVKDYAVLEAGRNRISL
jgi:hypothetical protein